ncbi:hypothetical protein ABZT16_43790 [Streptomyces flaveolus]|uniref:hypothetical protein n=1 Tax=Streptomyces flaveolus TaxID=67297 RepID=UPI0033A5C039
MDSLIQALQEVSQTDADFAADTHQATDESGNGRIFNQYVELHDQYVKLRNEQVVSSENICRCWTYTNAFRDGMTSKGCPVTAGDLWQETACGGQPKRSSTPLSKQ